jgi:hypothetical protein
VALKDSANEERKYPRRDDIEAARERAEEASEDEGGVSKIHFEDGFTSKVMIGTLFVCLIMLPGAIYLGLVAGQSLGGAAQWVTIVLFSEIARRSFHPLKRQEIYCLYYMAGALTVTGFSALPGISGGPFGGWIGNAYLMQSPAMVNVAPHLPHWVAPAPGSSAYLHRSFLDPAWWVPFWTSPGFILIAYQVLDRMKWIGLGYSLFRLTSDVERLPFPMAPVAASGATALAEVNSKEDSWRWRVFSTGTIIGLIFGFFYLAVPIFTGVVFSRPVTLLPIPFFDLTPNIERMAPTSLLGYNPDLGALMIGFILPFPIVLGGVISSVATQTFGNPILYHMGKFPHWISGSPAIQTNIATQFDFWMSINIGVQLAVALIGFASVGAIMFRSKSKETQAARGSLAKIPEGRGDIPIVVALGAWALATVGFVILNHNLVPTFPISIIIFYGLIWTPLNSYITARIIALTGQPAGDVPFLNQAVVLGAHYTKPDIWFAPLPLNNYGGQTQKFRELELTGTKFTSIIKVEFFMLPFILLFSFIYWGFLWYTNDIPSAQFPYAQKLWPQFAVQQSIWSQINAPGGADWVKHAIKPALIEWGGAGALVFYMLTRLVNAPGLFFYGFVGNLTNYPHNTIPMFLGALLGRYYFTKVVGRERWQLYAPVLLAGYSCGMGLIGMCAIALALINKTVSYLPF